MRRSKGHKTWPATWLARRAEAVELHKMGKSYRTIARMKRVSVGFVAAAVKRYNDTKSHLDRKRSGRPPKVTDKIAKKVTALLRNREVGTVRKVRAKLLEGKVELSRGTIQNIAHRQKLRSAVPLPRPLLTPEHRAARLAWAKLHINDNEERIMNYAFADEKHFQIEDASHRVWLLPWEPTPIRTTRKNISSFFF